MSDAYWYPSNSRLTDLQRDLSSLNQQMVRSDYTANGEFVPLVLKALIRSNTVTGFPSHQIDRWIWVALQFHFAKNADVLDAARGALTFVTRLLARNSLTDADVRDINWILDSTIHLMTKNPGVQPLWNADEVSTILSELNTNDHPQDFDAAAIKDILVPRIEELKALSASPTFETILGKLDALFEAAEADNFEGNLARRVLLALADRCVKDSELVGPLNIMRDAYVVEAAYASVAHRTRYLPLLTGLLVRWPFVSSLPIVGQSIRPLDRYAQYIACVCLHYLFDRKRSLLVVRNNSVHCIIAAVMAAIETMRRETDLTNLGLSGWSSSQAITISDGTRTFKAIFIRALEISGKKKFLLGVRGNGSITVDDSILPFIATATEPHKLLSPGNDILVWLKRRHPDPLIFMTGSSRRRLMQQECILLLSAKNKFDEYITSVRPLNASPAALFGLTYVSSQHEFENLSGTAVETSRIYVCSDVDVAADLIREPPEHVGAWRVIVDGARTGAALLAAFPNLSDSNAQSICVVGELHERESCSEIINGKVETLFLEDSHVEVPPTPILSTPRPHDAACKMLLCQRSHSAVSTEFHSVNDVFLEDLSLTLKSRERNGDHSETTMLDLQLSEFLKKAISRPVGSEITRNALRSMAQSIVAQASVDRQYDQGAEKIFALFNAYLGSDGDVFDRSEALGKIAESVRHSESVAVLCRSESIAKECCQALPPDSKLRRFEWLGIQGLRRAAPWDRIIVVGWLDRFAMRELNNSGYGNHLDFALLPFEREWFNSTINANRRFERNLDAAGGKVLADLEAEFNVHRSETAAEVTSSNISDDAVVMDLIDQRDTTDFERIEARALDAMLRMVAQPKVGQATATAQLVIFEETGSYAYLPPAGKVIVLPGQGTTLDEGKLAAGLAEQLLFRSVGDLAPGMVLALPVETDRDLVDARADQFLQDPSRVRLAAAMWKDAIRRYIGGDPRGHVRFAKSLSEAGRSREPSTVRSWVSHSATVAPSNYRELIPLIAKLTNDVELKAKCVEVMQSVDQIYRAKSRAADAIVRELFSGAIDTEQDELSFDLNGHKLRYQLRHVKSLAGVRKVPSELIGKSARVVEAETAIADALRPDVLKRSEVETAFTAPAVSVLTDPPSIDLPTTVPSELIVRSEREAEIENHSLEAVRSRGMERSEDETALTAPAVSVLTDSQPVDPATAKSSSQKEIEGPETAITADTAVSDRTVISNAVDANVVRATPSYKVAGIDVQIDFDALHRFENGLRWGTRPSLIRGHIC